MAELPEKSFPQGHCGLYFPKMAVIHFLSYPAQYVLSFSSHRTVKFPFILGGVVTALSNIICPKYPYVFFKTVMKYLVFLLDILYPKITTYWNFGMPTATMMKPSLSMGIHLLPLLVQPIWAFFPAYEIWPQALKDNPPQVKISQLNPFWDSDQHHQRNLLVFTLLVNLPCHLDWF